MELEDSIRSDEVQEIMERMPKKFIKWGSVTLLLLIFLLVILASIIEYPDAINGSVLLTTQQPATTVFSKITGNIEKILVYDKSNIGVNSPLAVLKNRTSFENVMWIDSILNSNAVKGDAFNYLFWTKQSSRFEDLGEIAAAFSTFLNSLRDYAQLTKNKITIQQALGNPEKKQIYNIAWNVIIQSDRLKQAIIFWKDRNIIKAPINGIVTFPSNWSIGQGIKSGDIFCIIIPEVKNIVCRVYIPVDGSSKVKKGQKVRITLSNYPENEFGFIEGNVISVSSVPILSDKISNYQVNVSINTPIVTSMQKEIEYMPEMQGNGEIILEKKSILARIMQNWLNYF